MSNAPTLPATMVWHIFKKDLRLLWPLALAGAVGQLLLALLVFRSQHAGYGAASEAIAALLTAGLIVTMGLIIVLGVQHDALPTLNQDWLVRPIKRRDLLLAKLLFVALLIHLPIIVSGLLRGWTEGLPWGAIMRATLLSSFEIALVFSLPLMAIAALTKSVTEAIIAALLVFFLIMFVRVMLPNAPTADSGIGWVWQSASRGVLLLMTSAVLLLQYFTRDSRRSRWLFGAAILLFMLTRMLPWSAAFDIQQSLSPAPEARVGPAIDFDVKAVDGPMAGTVLIEADAESGRPVHRAGTTVIALPMRISGLRPGTFLHTDRVKLRVIGPDGKTLYSGTADGFDAGAQRSIHDPSMIRERLELPTAAYAQSQHAAVTLELHYWFTVLRVHTLTPFPALIDDVYRPDVGHCSSNLNAAGTAIDLRCFQTQALPPCTSASLEHPGSATRNAEVFDCTMDYEPKAFNFSSESIDHFHSKLPFKDPSGVAQYAVDASKLDSARVFISVYEPQGHYSKSVTIADVRLQDLAVP